MATITQSGDGFTGNNPNVGEQFGPVLNVTEGDIPDTDQLGQFENLQDPASQFATHWQDYIITSRFEKDGQTWMLPVTSPDGFQGDSVAFVQLASPTLLWIVDWTAYRTGRAPIIPSPFIGGNDWRLLDYWHEPSAIELEEVDAVTPRYRISGTYIYGHRKPPDNPLDYIVFPILPWVDNIYQRTITSDLYNNFLTTTGGGVGGAAAGGNAVGGMAIPGQAGMFNPGNP